MHVEEKDIVVNAVFHPLTGHVSATVVMPIAGKGVGAVIPAERMRNLRGRQRG